MKLLERLPSYSASQHESQKGSDVTVEIKPVSQDQANECVHSSSEATPALNAHLRDARTQACITDMRNILNSLIIEDSSSRQPCIKCATTSAVSTLVAYANEMREAKRSGEWSKSEIKAMKKEVKGLAKGLKREQWPAMKKSWKQKP